MNNYRTAPSATYRVTLTKELQSSVGDKEKRGGDQRPGFCSLKELALLRDAYLLLASSYSSRPSMFARRWP